MARIITNGTAQVLECAKHPESTITIYGAPSTDAWCYCGRPMKVRRRSSTSKNNA